MPDLKKVLDQPEPRLAIGEMYCGPGGIAVGARNAFVEIEGGRRVGYRHRWATDYDPDTCQTYSNNVGSWDQCEVVCADIRDLDISNLPEVEGFLYGFPCNDFSNVGESKGLEGRFGGLYKFGVEFIDSHNPLFFFAENVSGLSSANSGRAFEQIIGELASAGDFGYITTVHLYRFEEYGVPQARHRIIAVGIRADLGLTYQVPAPRGDRVSSRQAIEEPPIPADATNNDYTQQSAIVQERLSHIKPGQNAWNSDLPPHLQLNVKGAKLSHIYKRLDPAKPSYTITGSGGGGTHVYHWKENRALTNRERARLQTFPDDFNFFGSKESVRKQIGMAVPPLGAQVILEAVLKTLVEEPYESVEPSLGFRLPKS